MIVGHVATAWDVFEMGYLVRTGRMSPKLLRPILPIWESVADNLAYKTITLVILVPIWAGVAWVTRPHFATTSVDLALGVPALLLGAVVHYIWNYNVGLAAFWLTRTDALSGFWWGMNLFMGGRLAPLQALPGPVQWLAAVLPFKWIIWFPAAALMGTLSPREMVVGLGAQIAWLAAGIVVFRVMWRTGVKQYSAVGA
jgi:ABC-2 type transport system permease protein